MRHGKAIEGFINDCLKSARMLGFRQDEMDKLHKVLVGTRSDMSASQKLHAAQSKLEKQTQGKSKFS
jgi:hypothetical protein